MFVPTKRAKEDAAKVLGCWDARGLEEETSMLPLFRQWSSLPPVKHSHIIVDFLPRVGLDGPCSRPASQPAQRKASKRLSEAPAVLHFNHRGRSPPTLARSLCLASLPGAALQN